MEKLSLFLRITIVVFVYSLSSNLLAKENNCVSQYLSKLRVDSISLELTLPFYHTELIVNITPCKQEIKYYFYPKSSIFYHPDDSIAPLSKIQCIRLLSGIDSLYISKKKKICERIVKGRYEVDQIPPPPYLTIRIYRAKRKTIKDVISLKDIHPEKELDITYKVFSKTFIRVVDMLYSLAEKGGLMDKERESKRLIPKKVPTNNSTKR